MSDSCWKLTNERATLSRDALSAQIDLEHPSLTGVAYRGHQLAGVEMLGVVLDVPPQPIADAYIRGDDLVVTYAATPARNVRVQAYWRCMRWPLFTSAAVIDLQISVQTPLLDSDPGQTVRSTLPAGDMLRLDGAASKFKQVVLSVRGSEDVSRDKPPACYLVRPAGEEFSYVEMVHPADACGSELGDLGDRVGLAHELFKSSLEKGVILRARLRGALVPRAGDEAVAAALYADLLAAEPPLTT
jgi:hypothetical protein